MEKACEINPQTWVPVEEAVLCFLRDTDKDRILLIHKKTGLGAGLINAPGGRIEKGESPKEAAIRETREEVGMVAESPELKGELFFQFTNGHSIRGYVFESCRWSGNPVETSEADPFWCSIKDIPYDRMWADDSWWLPHMLSNRPFRGRFIFDEDKMLSMSLDVEAKEGIPRNRAGSK